MFFLEAADAEGRPTCSCNGGEPGFVRALDFLTPVPEWKCADWAAGALPRQDPARDPGDREVLGR